MIDRRGLLRAFSGVKDENLRALMARLVQVYREHEESAHAPLAHYRAAIESYADQYGDTLDPSYEEPLPTGPESLANGESGSGARRPFITLESLTVENFGSYCGQTTISLAPVGNRNVTVVVGSNGDGKSTLFMALNWALFGNDYIDELQAAQQRELADLVNRAAALAAGEQNCPVEVSVELAFSVEGVKYFVTRAFQATVTPRGEELSISVQLRPTKLRRLDASGNLADLLEGALVSLLSQLPARVRDFYLFDGEKINRFVAPGAQRAVRSAIRRVVGIEALETTAEHLRRVSAHFRSEARRLASGDLARIQDSLARRTDELARTQQDIERLKGESLGHRSRVEEIDAFLSSTRDTRPLQQRRKELEDLLKRYEEEEESLVFTLRELACHASTLFASEAVGRLIEELDRRREAGVIPGPISEQLIKDLLDLGECICGTPVGPEAEARRRLEARLEMLAEQSRQSEFQLGLFYQLGSSSRWVVDKAAQLDRGRIELSRIREHLRDARSMLREVSEQLEGIEVVDRSGWEAERREREQAHIRCEAKILSANERIEELKREIERLKVEEQREMQGQMEAAVAATRANWAEAAELNIRNVFAAYAAQARAEIERETTRLWKAMLPNVEAYRVSVSDDFELSAIDELGRPAMQELAMGQQQCLGLAFIMSVAQVAETKPPLVIDMPFGRLGSDTASSVAAKLPQLTEQLILFVLPGTEWNSSIQEAIGPALARQYSIKYDYEAHCTRVAS